MNSPTVAPPQLLTIKETAAILAVSRRTVEGLIATGTLPSVHIGRAVRLDLADIDRYVKLNKERRQSSWQWLEEHGMRKAG